MALWQKTGQNFIKNTSEEAGRVLSIDVNSGRPHEVFGVGGKASIYYLHKVGIEVGGKTHVISAGFMPSVAGRIMPYGIVGQRGFFEHFVVKFDLANEEIELKHRQ